MRALATTLAVLTVAASVAATTAGSAAASPVGGSFAGAPGATVSRWTPARRAAAEPMSVLPLTSTGKLGGAPLESGAASGTSAEAGTSATTTGAPTAPPEGVDTGDPTLFPNRANGTVYGVYVIDGQPERYQCSGSVIDSPAGDVVLTAGHCVIDPETGTVASSVIFVPGYREETAPFGVWAASTWVTPSEWQASAGSEEPDEAADLALLVLAPNPSTGASVEATVGALAIGFEEPRLQTYTQWGYPGKAPYPEGQILYSHTTPFAGIDPFYPPAVAPIRIASDFTAGASGGPWTIGPTSAPTVLSLTDYFYKADPGHLYGAYLGAVARRVYEAAAGVVVPTAASEPPVPPAATPAPTPSPPPPTAPSRASGSLRILAARDRSTRGEATVVVHVGGPGTLRLSGPSVRTVSATAGVAGNYRLEVSVKAGSFAARALRRRGRATVEVKVRFASPVGVRRASRLVPLRY